MKTKMKRSTKQCILVALLSVGIVGGAAIITYWLMTAQIRASYEAKIATQEAEMLANQRAAYVALRDIAVGECITIENVQPVTVYGSQPQENYLTEDELGRLALVLIPTGTHVLKTMATDQQVAEDAREVLFDVISINPNLLNDETVDIRIMYPNGENYIVLSKKNIKNWDGGTDCYLWLNEEEILLMSSAMVDAYLYPGSSIYTAKYIEPNLQGASVVTYIPSEESMALIKSDPNIIEVASEYLSEKLRRDLESRLVDTLDDNAGYGSTGNKYIDGTINLDPIVVDQDEDHVSDGYFK